MMRIKEIVKRALDGFFHATLAYRLVPDAWHVDQDEDVWRHLRESGFSPRHVVDVGAARGEWAKAVFDVWPKARYLMVDPLAENEEPLKSVAQSMNGSGAIWMGALGKQAGNLEFFVHSDQSSMFDSEWMRDGGVKRSVPMRTLDSAVEEIGFEHVDLLKLDVQGAELEVLAGGENVLRHVQAVQCEVSFRRIYRNAPLAHEVIRFFAEQGFRIYDIASVIKGKNRALLQADVFFVKNDALCMPEQWTL